MDLKKAKILISKVNTLFQSMSADETSIAPIEKDLMRSYLRDLYEQFHNPALQDTASAPVSEKEDEVEEIWIEKASAPAPPPPPKPKPKPRIIEIPDSLKERIEVKKPEPAPVQEPKYTPPPPPPAPDPEPEPEPEPAPAPEVSKPIVAARPKDLSEDVAALFEMSKATELSEKLSELPIRDLTKAMGLNERIFTINELFGGDQDAFDSALKQLNSVEDFDDARNYLMTLADKFAWGSKNKSKKAQNFIKLVRRRYQN
ncbi:MAG: hypothetical protein KDC34_11745 [Saprospiraceae bacterium]|nr:hypothetical protein [Saprospiraceae bacterium]